MDSQEIKLEPPEEHNEEPLEADPILDGMIDLSKLLESQIDQFGNSDYPDYNNLGPIRSDSHSSRNYKPHNRNCSVCSITLNERHVTHIRSPNTRLMLMVGAVLSGKKTVEEAQFEMTKSRSHCCKSHPMEMNNAIWRVLNIRNINEMQSCSTENEKKLMTVVDQLAPGFTLPEFLKTMHRFNPAPEKETRVRQPKQSYREHHRPCCLCSSSKPDKEQCRIRSENRKLIVLVSLIITGKKTVEEAQLMLPVYSDRMCKTHPLEAVNEILKFLKIQNIEEMQWCSMDNQEKLMTIVNSLSPDCSIARFYKWLTDFVKKLSQMTC